MCMLSELAGLMIETFFSEGEGQVIQTSERDLSLHQRLVGSIERSSVRGVR